PLQGSAKLVARQDGLLTLDLFIAGYRRLNARDEPPGQDLAIGQRQRRFVTGVLGVVEEYGEGLTSTGIATGAEDILRRFLEADGYEPRRRRDFALFAEQPNSLLHFCGVEWFQWVSGRRGGHASYSGVHGR